MKNTVNIDLNNNSCCGVANVAGVEGENSITLFIKILEEVLNKELTLEITKQDGVILLISGISLTIESGSIIYDLTEDVFLTEGIFKVRVLAEDYNSNYYNFKVLANYTADKNICVKYNSLTEMFNIECCETETNQEEYEVVSNKTTTVDNTSTNVQYPSAKAVYNSTDCLSNTEIEKLLSDD